MAFKNDDGNIGARLARLLQQYALRIDHAKYCVDLYENERQRCSAMGLGQKALKAQIAKGAWNVYADSLIAKKKELESDIRDSLIGYNATQRQLWFAYFIEGKPCRELAVGPLTERTVQRQVAQMKSDMALRFNGARLLRVGESQTQRWSYSELASFLEESPSQDYLKAVRDMIEYGIVDADALEFDEDFQNYLETGERGT